MYFIAAIVAYAEICGDELNKMLPAWEFIYGIFEVFHLSGAWKQMGF